MAILARGVAVVSVGIGCQGTHQIGEHGALIGEWAGATPKQRRTPLDWIVCPPKGVASMIRDWRFYPEDPAQIIKDETPYWPQANCWYWHDEAHLTSGEFVSRQEHYLEVLEQCRAMPRQIFVLSNTQRNLDEMARSVSQPMNIVLHDEDVDAIDAALKSQFPDPELWVLALKGRHALQRHQDNPRVLEFDPEPSKWKGDYGQWGAALTRMLAAAD